MPSSLLSEPTLSIHILYNFFTPSPVCVFWAKVCGCNQWKVIFRYATPSNCFIVPGPDLSNRIGPNTLVHECAGLVEENIFCLKMPHWPKPSRKTWGPRSSHGTNHLFHFRPFSESKIYPTYPQPLFSKQSFPASSILSHLPLKFRFHFL